MAATYEEIIGYLNEEKIGYSDLREKGRDGIGVNFSDGPDDEMSEYVIIKLDEDGEFVHFYEPQRYMYADGEHKAKVLETLLLIQWESKMLQWEYDPSDGEIRACIELPLEDAPLTKRLFMRVLKSLVRAMDHYHERIEAVMQSGIDPGDSTDSSEVISLLDDMIDRLRDEDSPSSHF